MSLFSLKDIRNHPRRSAFDLSSKVAFSAKSGELREFIFVKRYPKSSQAFGL
nr:MAG TPA: Major capsid protein [Microviridae sp.]